MSMIGELNFFLRLRIKQTKEAIFINQAKYTKKILKKFEHWLWEINPNLPKHAVQFRRPHFGSQPVKEPVKIQFTFESEPAIWTIRFDQK